jgi:protein tyrosine/serine phosphatase
MPPKAEELRIDGLENVRDLGGLVTRDGRVVRSRQVIRSDNPKGLTEKGQEELADVVAPALVVDLRMVLEVTREGYTIGHDPTRVVNLPMLPQSGINQEQIDAGAADNLVDDYCRQLDVNADSIVEALRLIAEPANRPVVVHCTAGTDRTGIVIAMLLDILGVDHEVIVADYHVTAANMAPILERIRAAQVFQDTGLADAPMWIFESHPETMREFLARMVHEHGAAERWALGRGLAAADLARLRATLLDPIAPSPGADQGTGSLLQ